MAFLDFVWEHIIFMSSQISNISLNTITKKRLNFDGRKFFIIRTTVITVTTQNTCVTHKKIFLQIVNVYNLYSCIFPTSHKNIPILSITMISIGHF